MRDLVRETGVPVATLHFYAASGLLPQAQKQSRTSARYSTATIDRVRWIRSVQQELRLPLRAIRGILDELGQIPVSELRTRMALGEMLGRQTLVPPAVDAPELDAGTVAALEEMGLIAAAPDGERGPADQRLMRLVAAMRAAGFTEEAGFRNDQLLLYRDAMRDLVRAETRRIVDAGRRLGPEEASMLVERGLPAIDELVRFFHLRAISESIDAWRELTQPEGDAER